MRAKALRRIAGATGAGVAMATALMLSADDQDGAARAQAADQRPNVVMIMTDDQRVADMDVLARTRALIGDQGTTFANSFATFPLCCPSRSTYLTGQYAHNHGVRGNKPAELGGYPTLYRAQRPNGQDTLPVWMSGAGYATAHIGKYLNGYGADVQPTVPNGWQNWAGSVDGSTYNFKNYCLNENGSLVWYGKRNSCPARLPSRPGGEVYQADNYTQKARQYVARQVAGGPFFLSVAYLAPHGGGPKSARCGNSAKPAPRHVGRFEGAQVPRGGSYDEPNVSDKPSSIRALPRLTAQDKANIDRAYKCRREALLAVDEGVSGIVDELRASGELDNTLILFTSDNGFLLGQHRVRSGKIRHYEESSRVPLLIRGPGVRKGARVRKQAGNIDLAATILDAANARATRRLDGRSLLRAGEKGFPNRDILLEDGPKLAKTFQFYKAIRTPRFKLVQYANGERELYDLRSDPAERRSLHKARRYNAIERKLARKLKQLRNCAGPRECR
jgi:arylsulfatase A-like enzyme